MLSEIELEGTVSQSQAESFLAEGTLAEAAIEFVGIQGDAGELSGCTRVWVLPDRDNVGEVSGEESNSDEYIELECEADEEVEG